MTRRPRTRRRAPLRRAGAAAVLACGCGEVASPGPPPPPPPPAQGHLGLTANRVVDGLDRPVFLTAPPGDDRLYIVEQGGQIRIAEQDGAVRDEPFLDISGAVEATGERGLLSIAFHPNYAENRQAFVYYTDLDGNTAVERYEREAGSDRLDPSSAKRILSLEQRRSNHNGGQLAFGPDGMLFIFLGDEGGAGDPFGNGQNRNTLHGSILRLDVDGGDPYGIPFNNPYPPGRSDVRAEIWAIGLRNPWRSSFDPEGGMLYVADVGQDDLEEVNAVPADESGVNYGWSTMEGTRCYQAAACDESGLTLPVVEYANDGGACSVTGGYVYRGTALPEVFGHYFYSDFCAGFLRSFRLDGGRAVDEVSWSVGDLGQVSSFGVDGRGELYVLDHGGAVFRLEHRPPSI